MRRMVLGLMSILVFVSIASAQVQVSPETLNITMYGGDTATKTITLSADDEDCIVVVLVTNITEANNTFLGYELNVTFSENPVVLCSSKVVQVNITTLPNIFPDIYTVNIDIAGVEVVPTPKDTGRSSRETWWWSQKVSEVNVTRNITQNVTIEIPVPAEPICGNGICEENESESCPEDCEPIVNVEYVHVTQPPFDATPLILAGILVAMVLAVQFGFVAKKKPRKSAHWTHSFSRFPTFPAVADA